MFEGYDMLKTICYSSKVLRFQNLKLPVFSPSPDYGLGGDLSAIPATMPLLCHCGHETSVTVRPV